MFLYPGGHIDSNDINPLEASKREVFEETGFDDIWSLYMFLKSTGAIVAGTKSYLRGYENMKFSQKDFKDKLFSDPMFAQAFNEVARTELEMLLAMPQENTGVINSSQNIIDNILGL